MNKLYRLTVIADGRQKPYVVGVKVFASPYLTRSMLHECYNIMYKDSQVGYSNIVRGAIHVIDPDKSGYTLVSELTAVTFYQTWPDPVPRTNIYLNNKYIRSMCYDRKRMLYNGKE